MLKQLVYALTFLSTLACASLPVPIEFSEKDLSKVKDLLSSFLDDDWYLIEIRELSEAPPRELQQEERASDLDELSRLVQETLELRAFRKLAVVCIGTTKNLDDCPNTVLYKLEKLGDRWYASDQNTIQP